jgi:hypothetical protein
MYTCYSIRTISNKEILAGVYTIFLAIFIMKGTLSDDHINMDFKYVYVYRDRGEEWR